MEDPQTLDFLKAQAQTVRIHDFGVHRLIGISAAGLLRVARPPPWAYHDLLAPLGAIPVQERVVRDGNLFTGGGITAASLALTLAAELYSKRRRNCATANRIRASPTV